MSPKSSFPFGFLMVFADQSAYEAFNAHPLARRVRPRPLDAPEVNDFQELDYVPFKTGP